MDKEIAIRLSGIKKKYRLGVIGGRTLQAELQSWWAKRRGREDPNLRIGIDQRLIGQEFWALNGIDLTIYQGERVGIIGANGAGKSTMLKLLCRVTAPTDGEIDIWGRITSMLEIGTGFHGEMTGRENIYMNGAILGMSKTEIDNKIEDIIEFSEVRDFIDTPVKRYSSGMFVKLAFAVAAHLNSEIMIMDEVLAVGDMAFQTKCLEKMKEAADKEGRTILYVSHNMDTIRRLCDRCVVMDQGKIIFDGNVEEAIGIYMNNSLDENAVRMDLSDRSRAFRAYGSRGIRMAHLELTGKTEPVYRSGEDLELALTVQADREFEEVYLRLTFRTEADVGVGTSWTKLSEIGKSNNLIGSPADVAAGFQAGEHTGQKEKTAAREYVNPAGSPQAGMQTLRLSMPLESVAAGIFYVSIGLYRKDELGRMIGLDHITRAFRIEVIGPPIWNTSAHGFIRLPEMRELL